jgi:hypothetical protein
MENEITEPMVEYIKEQLKEHPMMEILSNIMTVSNEDRQEDDPESWALTIHRVSCVLAGARPDTNVYAEAWLSLGELRNMVRMVVNHDPNTEEPDELFYRKNPGAIHVDFESFVGIVVHSMNSYAQSEVPKHLIN